MTDDDTMAQEAARFLRLKAEKAGLEERLAGSERALRRGLKERRTMNAVFGDNVVRLVRVGGTNTQLRVVPADRMNGLPHDGVPF